MKNLILKQNFNLIPDTVLHTGNPSGRELEPHITLLYGVDDQKPETVIKDFDNVNVNIELGPISKFEKDDYDVIKIDVISNDLQELYSKFDEKYKPNKTYPEYKPHITLAFVNKGACDDILGKQIIMPKDIVLKKFLFCTPKDNHIFVKQNCLRMVAGLSEGMPDSKFNKKQIELGIKVEQEHTDDKALAKQIAKDHLVEIPDYYTRLKKMEEDYKREKHACLRLIADNKNKDIYFNTELDTKIVEVVNNNIKYSPEYYDKTFNVDNYLDAQLKSESEHDWYDIVYVDEETFYAILKKHTSIEQDTYTDYLELPRELQNLLDYTPPNNLFLADFSVFIPYYDEEAKATMENNLYNWKNQLPVYISLTNYNNIVDRFEQIYIDENKVNSVQEALESKNILAIANLLYAFLDYYGYSYSNVSASSNSQYIEIDKQKLDEDGDKYAYDSIKVRIADHPNQSSLHNAADFNIVLTDKSYYTKLTDLFNFLKNNNEIFLPNKLAMRQVGIKLTCRESDTINPQVNKPPVGSVTKKPTTSPGQKIPLKSGPGKMYTTQPLASQCSYLNLTQKPEYNAYTWMPHTVPGNNGFDYSENDPITSINLDKTLEEIKKEECLSLIAFAGKPLPDGWYKCEFGYTNGKYIIQKHLNDEDLSGYPTSNTEWEIYEGSVSEDNWCDTVSPLWYAIQLANELQERHSKDACLRLTAKAIDNIQPLKTVYFDDNGIEYVPISFDDAINHMGKHETMVALTVGVKESIFFKDNPKPLEFETTINCIEPIVLYLIKNRHWSMVDAILYASQTCERCLNILLEEVTGTSYTERDSCHTHCRHCKEIDHEYDSQYIDKTASANTINFNKFTSIYNVISKIAKVVKHKDGWHVLSETGKNLGGPYKTEPEAVKRLRQVEYFKHHT